LHVRPAWGDIPPTRSLERGGGSSFIESEDVALKPRKREALADERAPGLPQLLSQRRSLSQELQRSRQRVGIPAGHDHPALQLEMIETTAYTVFELPIHWAIHQHQQIIV
jgi:hypothetical protein